MLLDVPIADKLVDLALFIIFGTWGLFAFAVFGWLIFHVDKLTPDVIFRKRQPVEKGQPGSTNWLAIASFIVADVSLIAPTLIGIAQLLRH